MAWLSIRRGIQVYWMTRQTLLTSSPVLSPGFASLAQKYKGLPLSAFMQNIVDQLTQTQDFLQVDR